MPRRKPHEQHSLFAIDGGQKDPSPVLSLVGDHAATDPENSGDRSPESPKPAPYRSPGRPKKGKFGRPNNYSDNEEQQWPSRHARDRRGGRFNPELLEKLDEALKKQKKPYRKWQAFVDWAIQFFLDLGGPDLGVRATACGSCSSCGIGNYCSTCGKLKELNTTTTTTAVARTLPGLPADLLEMPHKTRHALEVLWGYARSSYRREFPEFEGVAKPNFWIRTAWTTGKYDSMVDAWLAHKRQLETDEEERKQRLAAECERQRLELAQLQLDREERKRTGEKPWQIKKE